MMKRCFTVQTTVASHLRVVDNVIEFTSSFSLEVSNESRYNSGISSTVVHVNTLISSPPSIRRWRVLHLVPIVLLSVLVLLENWRGDLAHLGFSFLTLSAKHAGFYLVSGE